MADFNTHFFTATAVGAVYATLTTKGLGMNPEPALLMACMTAVGGILPDIDLKDSTPSRALFLVLGAGIAILGMLNHVARFSVAELLILGAATFLVVRFILRAMFHRFTVHRGSLHSLAACAMFGTVAVVLCSRVWALDADVSWLTGFGVFIGCLSHLVLDELYSVDFTGARIKRSFGTALKVIDRVRWEGSLAVVATTIAALYLTPSAKPLLKTLQTVDPNWRDWLLAINF